MKVLNYVLCPIGTTGDVNPYNLLAVSLVEIGHTVTLCIPKDSITPVIRSIEDSPNFHLVVLPVDVASYSVDQSEGLVFWKAIAKAVGSMREDLISTANLVLGLDWINGEEILIINQGTMWFIPFVFTDWVGQIIIMQTSAFRYDGKLGVGSFYPRTPLPAAFTNKFLNWIVNDIVMGWVTRPVRKTVWGKGNFVNTKGLYRRAKGFIYLMSPILLGFAEKQYQLAAHNIFVTGPPITHGVVPDQVRSFVETAKDAGRKVVLVAIGSAGTKPALIDVLKEFREVSPEYMFVVAGYKKDTLDANILAAPYVPYCGINGAFDAIIAGGGSQTSALLALSGTPMAVLPSFPDQVKSAEYIQEFGAGVMLEKFTRQGIQNALSRIDSPEVEVKSKQLAALLDIGDPLELVGRAILQIQIE